MASNASLGDGHDIPGFGSSTKTLAELVRKENWPELEIRLSASGMEQMWIKDESSRSFFDRIRCVFDRSEARDGADRGNKIFHTLAVEGDEALMRRLLSLGLNPDVKDPASRIKPSHTCCRYFQDVCLEILTLCRADLTAINGNGQTPVGRAEAFLAEATQKSQDGVIMKRFHRILTTCKIIEITGPPSLAQLASNQQWWAVKNLCRRKAVDSEEVRSKHRGRDAVEWALHHGANDLADEIRFLYGFPSEGDDPASAQSSGRSNQDDTKGMLQELIVTFGERVSCFEEEFKKLDSRLRAQEERTQASAGLSVWHQTHEADRGRQRSLAQSAAALGSDETGENPVLQAVDCLWKEIRSKAVDSGQELVMLSELGALLVKLKRA